MSGCHCARGLSDTQGAHRVRRPLFPGYLFVNLDIDTARWRSINGTVGVSRIVSFGQKPSSVSDDFISNLKEAEGSDGLIATGEDSLRPGQDVEILNGPMAGTIGKLLRLEAGNRVTILLSMLGHVVQSRMAREAVAGT